MKAGIDLECLLALRECIIKSARVKIRVGKIGINDERERIQLDRMFRFRDRTIELPGRFEPSVNPLMRGCIIWVELRHAFEFADRLCKIVFKVRVNQT